MIISTDAFLVREGGGSYLDRKYLSLGRRGSVDGAVDVLERSGLETFGILTHDVQGPAVDAVEVGATKLTFLGDTLWLHSYDVPKQR